jgi:hypothetical protein
MPLMYRPPIFFDAVKKQVLSDGNLIVQVEGKRRIALACILFTGRSTLSVYQFGRGVGGGVASVIKKVLSDFFFYKENRITHEDPQTKKL